MSYHLVFFSKISRNFNSTFIEIVNNLESPLLLYIKLPSLAQYVYTKNTLNWCTNLNFNHYIYCQILIFSYLQSLPCTRPLLIWFFARMRTLTPRCVRPCFTLLSESRSTSRVAHSLGSGKLYMCLSNKCFKVHPVYSLCTLTGSPDPTHANGTNKPCNLKIKKDFWWGLNSQSTNHPIRRHNHYTKESTVRGDTGKLSIGSSHSWLILIEFN